MKILVVVDMQNDFITGDLGSDAAKRIVPKVKEKIENFDGRIIFTRDTHFENYLNTQEGAKLPVVHCIKGSEGWKICGELSQYAAEIVDKPTFGSLELPDVIQCGDDSIDEIELCGLCTDICVISNAMILKAAFPEVKIS
ncbi:MAG: isochorismatase family cysteine hydrolase, partial [Clostridia bacterium]|nr:isochorismatase family cysteine hydrolase [Clostridia bacterium]